MSVIEIENLVKTYGENVAVNDLSLNIEKGKVYGFLGPNGAGKSTTMNIITGYIGATKGTVRIGGHDIFKEPEQAKKCVGYLPEMPPLYQDMTVREYLGFVAELKQIPKKSRERDIVDALEKTKTTQVEGRLIKNLSKGYKQRVGIAQALIGMPEVIILDEPTVGLDPKQIIEIRQLIKELGRKHTVILSSHILSEISEVCDYIFIISQGKLAASGTEKELVEQMAGENILNVEIKGKKDKVSDVINSIDGIQNVAYEKSDYKDSTKLTINSERGIDIREKLFYACAEAKMPIISMNFKQKTLEDIFIELTKEYTVPAKKKKSILSVRKSDDTDTITREDIDRELEALESVKNTGDVDVDNSQIQQQSEENEESQEVND
ncbi:MAG: ABC transporter ATP-binding protein [Eubacterium sp.]